MFSEITYGTTNRHTFASRTTRVCALRYQVLVLIFLELEGYFLHGITRFGECQEDEQAVICLLCRLSSAFPEAYVRLTNEMGELLLVLGADVFDQHEKDEDYEKNNNWINRGLFLRIPFQKDSDPASFGIRDAYNYLKSGGKLSYSAALHKAAIGFVDNFPETARESFHRAKVFVPRAIATALHDRPDLISRANYEFEWSENFDPTTRVLPDIKHFDIFKDLVEVVVKFPKLVFSLWQIQPTPPPSWFSYFVPDDDSVSYDSAVLGTMVTAGMELLALRHEQKQPEEPLEVKITDLEFKLSEQALYEERIKKGKNITDHGKSEVKEELDEYLYEIKHPDTFNFIEYLKDLKLATDKEIQTWNKKVDSRQWLDEILAQKDEGDNSDFETHMKTYLENLKESVEKNGWEDEPENSSDEEETDQKDSKDVKSDPKIDEDDFFEFFLKEALKMTPEQIAQYESQVFDEASDEDEEAEEEDAENEINMDAFQKYLKEEGF